MKRNGYFIEKAARAGRKAGSTVLKHASDALAFPLPPVPGSHLSS